jgi:hypothetical protein
MVKFDGSFMEWKNRRKREVWEYIHSLVNSYFEFFFEKDLNYPSAFFSLLLLLFTSSFKGTPTPPISTISTFLLIHSLVLSRAQLCTSPTKPSLWYLWLCAFTKSHLGLPTFHGWVLGTLNPKLALPLGPSPSWSGSF